nr:uncharacterized protein LOC105950329 [Ipomoea trifida]
MVEGRKWEKLTDSFMGDVGEESSDLPLGDISRADRSELGIRLGCFQKRGSRVESFRLAARRGLPGDSVEERAGDDPGNRIRGCETRRGSDSEGSQKEN